MKFCEYCACTLQFRNVFIVQAPGENMSQKYQDLYYKTFYGRNNNLAL